MLFLSIFSSSGILDDNDSYRMLHDRSTSLDATFILEDNRIKLVELV